MKKLLFAIFILIVSFSCNREVKRQSFTGQNREVKLITLAPGHFHAALIQKNVIPQISNQVYVYAPQGAELDAHLKLIESYNTRDNNPTNWKMQVYNDPDFLERMLKDKKGNVVMLAGNNKNKTNYITQSVAAGYNVLSDKPMAISKNAFALLEQAYADADKNKVILYDMMTERYDVTNAIQKQLIADKDLFGELEKGTPENPAVESESVHHFLKLVSGSPLIRPVWYYDVEQQGDGIGDVTTHLIDLVMWKCFPEQVIDYKKNVKVNDASRWPTKLTFEQFNTSTNAASYPEFLQKHVINDTLHVFSNGYIQYEINGVQVKVDVVWNVQAPEGTGDTHRFIVRGTKADLLILQGKEQNYQPQLYIKKKGNISDSDFTSTLEKSIVGLQKEYTGLTTKQAYDNMILIKIPKELKSGHEAHFTKVVEKFLSYLVEGKQPQWEVANTLSKYYITTEALSIAKAK